MNYTEKIKASRLLKQIYAHDNVNLERPHMSVDGRPPNFKQ
nr:hypothetical protein [uncultured Acinetobacter sp.]